MQETALAPAHRRLGGQMVGFAGWSMPVRYEDIASEHQAVRERAGIFDLGHMGRVRVCGPHAAELVGRVQTMDAAAISDGRTRYALVCDEDGGILDDVLVSRDGEEFLVVVNAANRTRDLEFFRSHGADLDAEVVDESATTAMVAVQGPRSVEVLDRLGFHEPGALRYYRFVHQEGPFGPLILSRTGYTGEDGFEVILPHGSARSLWDRALEEGRKLGLRPCGLGARDTLRLEAGMPLYGHEIDRSTNPFEVGLGRAVKFSHSFVGDAALRRIRDDGPRRCLVGLIVDGPRVPRQGCSVLVSGATVGDVRSGTRSPSLGVNIATALVRRDAGLEAGVLEVDIRGHRARARVTPLPFYKR